jgi:hypothetical protein
VKPTYLERLSDPVIERRLKKAGQRTWYNSPWQLRANLLPVSPSMKTVELVQEADADKFVRLAIPVDEAARRYRLIVLIEPEANGASGEGLDEWPDGFFERTAGKWVGELVRQPQGDYEKRASL